MQIIKKIRRLYFVYKVKFVGLDEKSEEHKGAFTARFLLKYHLTSPIIEFYEDEALKVKVAEVSLKNIME